MSSWLKTTSFPQSERLENLDSLSDVRLPSDSAQKPPAITLDKGSTTSTSEPSKVQLTSFVLLISRLEQQLPNDGPFLFSLDTTFLNRSTLASGGFFSVERAEVDGWDTFWSEAKRPKPGWNKHVALKYVSKSDSNKLESNWKQLLLETRAFLHEPIRYHPNIVRFLAISWGPTQGSCSPFPAFILELSELGTLAQLQTNEAQLSFPVKKQLCWDVAKGVSILHACGIIHGDLKHNNVLVYPNSREPDSSKPYIAKLCDFGGSVMNLLHDEEARLHIGTPPYDAPDARVLLTEEGLKRTDVYSLGLLIWRTMLDGKNPFHSLASSSVNGRDFTDNEIADMKRSAGLTEKAKTSVHRHLQDLDDNEKEVLDYVFDNTIQYESVKRDLVNAIAALQVGNVADILELVAKVVEENKQEDERNANSVPFLFEPWKLKSLLDWNLQATIVHELEKTVYDTFHDVAVQQSNPTYISPTLASFYLFQSYMYGLGAAPFDPEMACYWLRQAAFFCEKKSEWECREGRLAQAWCWRVHRALNVHWDVPNETLREWMKMSNSKEKEDWKNDLDSAIRLANAICGGTGMPVFALKKIVGGRNWQRLLLSHTNTDDIDGLDKAIQEGFLLRDVKSLDEIYINHRGDGLLHMAAAIGAVGALDHLIQKYRPTIDLGNKHAQETPLLYACRARQFECAVHLLEHGASADGDEHAMNTPLHWLSSFPSEEQMMDIGARLVSAGASLKFVPRRTGLFFRMLPRHRMWSDFEELMAMRMSPLMRAIVMESVLAVKVLLTLGTDPLEGFESSRFSVRPVVLAAVLSLPNILQTLLWHVDQRNPLLRVFSDLEVIEMALDTEATVYDPLTLQRTEGCLSILGILLERDTMLVDKLIARLVSLEREDIVEMLLDMGPGYPVDGTQDSCPVIEAVKLNHETMFRLLVNRKANLFTFAKENRNDGLSLLQILAKHRVRSRPGTYIAEYLINASVPVNPPKDDSGRQNYAVISPPAFSFAVKHQDFELADLFFRFGADIEYAYRVNHEFRPNATIFADLVCHPTERNLESMKYLLDLRKPNQIPGVEDGPLPNFIASTCMKWSILHYAARDVVISDMESHRSRPGHYPV
ncbi:hypothetical protein K435DRAFT_851188 [Dendrothele bispora CBS 962.96]|uniref:Protein kinase domain-containing protein n=1 Tax=Dendrothele bispora (strain CBS 962.96) TaxID=1314807 RepID=A0A4S8MMR4_DENBC|nr:hypothetical protein K435DRAFT_851188 [Dendrothele bispora CBS 962.96]